jgi:hypothetical protein
MRFLFAAFAVLGLLGACSDDSSTEETNQPPEPKFGPAGGVSITEVAIYQGIKRTLAKDGAPQTSDIPLVAGRDAMIRVFYATTGDYDGKDVTGRLTIGDGEPIEVTQALIEPSSDGSISSTLNFFIPGDRVGTQIDYSVEIVQKDSKSDNGAARYPASSVESVPVEGPAQKFRVVIAPFQYDYDGSGRLPDLSEPTIEKYRTRLKQLFPVSDVEVTVRGATAWDNRIGPEGGGWQEVLEELFQYRGFDDASDDTYYYALFNPEDSFFDYCGGGCLLGLTLLNQANQGCFLPGNDDFGCVELRFAMGVGFDPVSYDTMAHEFGHAHGREHAPCGPGLDPQSIDGSYPHDGGRIGVWGLDPVTTQLYNPDAITDVMGYCEFTWISDYNYKAMFERGSAINLPKWQAAPRDRAVLLSYDDAGNVRWSSETTIPRNVAGERVPARVRRKDGTFEAANAVKLGFDHLPGGFLLVPGVEAETPEVEVTLEGRAVRVQRR